jgi:hypothetical protein
MKPAATKIDWKSKRVRDRPSASAKTRARFDDEEFHARVFQPSARRDSGRAAADDHGFDVIVRHLQESSQPLEALALM